MDGLTEKPTYFSFIFTPWKRIEIFYESDIIGFCAITTKWPNPKKHGWKRLSDLKEFINIYTIVKIEQKCDKNMWLDLGNKCEMYLFIKEMKKKITGNMTDITLRNLSYHRIISNIKKGGEYMMSEIYLFQFSKNTFSGKINLTTK